MVSYMLPISETKCETTVSSSSRLRFGKRSFNSVTPWFRLVKECAIAMRPCRGIKGCLWAQERTHWWSIVLSYNDDTLRIVSRYMPQKDRQTLVRNQKDRGQPCFVSSWPQDRDHSFPNFRVATEPHTEEDKSNTWKLRIKTHKK